MAAHARIDLHTHSTFSDGTETPTELLRAAKEAGLDCLALTDHDSTGGWPEAAIAAERQGIKLVRGEEVSANAGRHSVHILAYLHNPDAPGLRREAERSRTSRRTRARRMIELIGEDFDLDWNDVLTILGRSSGPRVTVGRPHLADALVAKGLAASRDEAFSGILAANSPYYVPYYAPDAVTAVRLILDAGGVPVVAHPGAVTRGMHVEEDTLEAMVEAGLRGVEVEHREHSRPARQWLRQFARSHGLFTTGSSDYHGSGKLNRLGENLTSPETLARLEAESTSGIEVLRP